MLLYYRIVVRNDDILTPDYTHDRSTLRQAQFFKRSSNYLGTAPVPKRNRLDGLGSTAPE